MSNAPRQAQSKAKGRICEVDGCETGVYQGGRCGYHSNVAREERRKTEGDLCAECDRGRFAKGLCRTHYLREYRRQRRAAAEQAVPDAGWDLP